MRPGTMQVTRVRSTCPRNTRRFVRLKIIEPTRPEAQMSQRHIDEGADFRFALMLIAALGVLAMTMLLA